MTGPSIEELMLDPKTNPSTGFFLKQVMDNATKAGLTLPEAIVAEWTNLLNRTGWRPPAETYTDSLGREYPVLEAVWKDLPNLDH